MANTKSPKVKPQNIAAQPKKKKAVKPQDIAAQPKAAQPATKKAAVKSLLRTRKGLVENKPSLRQALA